MPIVLGFLSLVFLYLTIYAAVMFAINNSEAVKLLTEIKVLLLKSQNENGIDRGK